MPDNLRLFEEKDGENGWHNTFLMLNLYVKSVCKSKSKIFANQNHLSVPYTHPSKEKSRSAYSMITLSNGIMVEML